MEENISLQESTMDSNCVMKRKRKRVSNGLDVSKDKGKNKKKEKVREGIPRDTEDDFMPVKKASHSKKLRDDVEIFQNQRLKGQDGYYFDCEVCYLGGNLLCCDTCPRTYHLECLNPPLGSAPPGKWQCPHCEEENDVKTSAKGNGPKLPNHDLHDNKTSNKGKHIISIGSPATVKKSNYSQAIKPSSLKSSSSGDTSDKDNVSSGEEYTKRSERKHVISVTRRDILKKDRHTLTKFLKKKRSQSHKSKNGKIVSHCKETEIGESVDKQAKASLENSVPTKNNNSMVLKLFLKKRSKISSQEASPSKDKVDERRRKEKGKPEYHENTLELIQQVDRVLGCRLQDPASDPKNGFELIEEFNTESKVLGMRDVNVVLKDDTEGINDLTETHQLNNTKTGNASHQADYVDSELNAEGISCLQKRNHTQPVPHLGSDDGKSTNYEFLVKWVGQSNIHNTWISEAELKSVARRKLENYKAKYGTAIINICEEQWCKPQRVLALRTSEDGYTKEAFIKWCGLPYDECTWEKLDEPIIEKYSHLISKFEELEARTLDNDSRNVVPRVKVESQELVTLISQPKELQGGSLFPHQLEALNWLRKCWHKSKNVILADEMGLGKTVSASAFISSLYSEFLATLPCLVLVPLSTMPNWMAEFSLWAPHLNVIEYHGHARARAIIRQYEWHTSKLDGSHKSRSYKFNVLLTTYEMVLADSSHLRGVPWEVLIVDEGHRLKNAESKLFSLLNTFSFKHRVLLTGTPLQNNIGEMYNLLNFLQPASFPSLSAFQEKFNDLTTAEKVEELKKLVAPCMLRRLKKDAMQNIPPKTERVVPVELTSIQAEYYRAMLTKNYQILHNAGKGGAQQSMLNIVMQLRKVCNHPYLIPGTEPESGSVEFLQKMRIQASAKLTLLHSMLKVLHKEGHRVLIFSQMTKLLDILEDYLITEYGPRTYERVDGSVAVADRQAAIARFNLDKTRFVFLLSTRSCGLGINLASADTVIIYDSDFNPHADIQAMNRAHRIGQSSRLLVYRLVVRASVEERILQLAKKKLMLDQLFVNKSESQKEVEDILKWGTEELFNCNYEADNHDSKDNIVSKEVTGSKVETVIEGERRHRRRSGGLGDVYQDRCADNNTKMIWDENAITKLLDRSNIQSSVSENADGDMENDMLGSVKSLDWSDVLNEHAGTEMLPGITEEDALEKNSEAKQDNVINATEESVWDKLLRERWEQYQVEEEAALGRGKRTRKVISYKETYPHLPSEELNESDDEKEELERIYTPAGLALKEKYSKLRTRQKERVAQRNNPEPINTAKQINAKKETQTSDANKQIDDGNRDVSPVNDEETDISTPFEANRNNFAPKSRNCGAKSNEHNFTVSSNPLSPSCLLPILGLCAPNAPQMNSVSKTAHSMNQPLSDREQKCKSSGLSENYLPTSVSYETVNNLNTGDSGLTRDQCQIPDTSQETSQNISQGTSQQRMKNIVSHNLHPFLSHSNGYLPSFQERLGVPNLNPNDTQFIPFPNHTKNPAGQQTGHFPNLSLGSNPNPVRNFPNLPMQPNFFTQPIAILDQKHTMQERPQFLSTGQMHSSPSSLTEIHKNILDNMMMRTQSMASSFRRTKLETWSEEELDSLWIGVRRHGKGNWEVMLSDPNLKFSKSKNAQVLAMRWTEEQQKLMDGPTHAMPRPLNSDTMNRAFFGRAEPSRLQSHVNDIRLACAARATNFPFNGVLQGNANLNLPLQRQFVHNLIPSTGMNLNTDRHIPPNLQPIETSTGMPSSMKSSKSENLPHWLRESFSAGPSRPPEPKLPPAVSAIAQSVRMIYGKEKLSIPPFSILGPPPPLPKDPRVHLKKKVHDSHQEAPKIAGSSKNVDCNASSSFISPNGVPEIEVSVPESLEKSEEGEKDVVEDKDINDESSKSIDQINANEVSSHEAASY